MLVLGHEKLRFGYTAKVRGAPLESEQRDILVEVGCAASKILDEGELRLHPATRKQLRPVRAEAIEYMRAGDELAVVSAWIAARNADDLFGLVADLSERGAALYVVDQARAFTAERQHADLARAFVKDRNEAQTAEARRSPKRKKDPGGRPKALELKGAQAVEFDRMWKDDAVSKNVMARHFGCSPATVTRRAGERGLGPKA